jgi:hypothetical protein
MATLIGAIVAAVLLPTHVDHDESDANSSAGTGLASVDLDPVRA